ncbi:MAG: permease-like cell division protein FtsX [Desulfobacterales bacterium]|jgi:cell division transport system permease protein
MIHNYKRAIQDIRDHKFLNAVTIITIAISILIVSAFALFFVNANEIINSWKKGIKIMVYLKPDTPETKISELIQKIQHMDGIRNVRFISKNEAFQELKKQMRRQSSLFENLKENPLPDAFEIFLKASFQNQKKVEMLATRFESFRQVDEVEYGQRWLGQFTNFFNLFRFTGYAMGGLFFMASLLIIANTIRLVLYSRQDEVEIMRLVGATDNFIKAPFYIQGLIQGAFGGIIGLAVLFVSFLLISSSMDRGISPGLFTIRFLSPEAFCGIIFGSTFVGWIGCYLSLKQFLK